MTWVRISDDFTDHHKVKLAGPQAVFLYMQGLCHAAKEETDGLLPVRVVTMLAGRRAASLAQTLLDVRLWDEDQAGYRIHNYLKYNLSHADLEAKREDARQRMTERRSQSVRANTSETTSEQNANLARAPKPVPRTQYPVPNTNEAPASQEAAKRRGGLKLDPLVDAFRDAGLPDPYFEAGNGKAAQAILHHHPPTEITDCWRDIAQGVFGDDFLRRNLSFRTLATNDTVSKWRAWDEAGRPAQRANGRAASVAKTEPGGWGTAAFGAFGR